jgi:hypothetical protein
VDTLFVGQRRNEVVLSSNLSKSELNQVHWRFVLLDFDGDGEQCGCRARLRAAAPPAGS